MDNNKKRLKLIKFEVESSDGQRYDLTNQVRSITINGEPLDVQYPANERSVSQEVTLMLLDEYYGSVTDFLIAKKS